MTNPGVQIIRGFPFPSTPWFKEKNIEDTLDYVPRDGDVIIASYPKTGTTWLQYITLQIVTGGESFPSFDDTLTKVVPFMEMTGVEAIESLEPPRIYKHHYPYNMVQKNAEAKYVYVHRNPADTFVSYFHFMKELKDDVEDFDQFFDNFLTGDIAYGSYFEHVRSYLDHKGDRNLLIVSYEDMLADRKREILRIAEFLGKEHFRNLTDNASVLEKITHQTSFDFMKKNLTLSHPMQISAETSPTKTINFFRKGTAGDGKKTMTQDQMKRLKEVTAETMKGTELYHEWLKE